MSHHYAPTDLNNTALRCLRRAPSLLLGLLLVTGSGYLNAACSVDSSGEIAYYPLDWLPRAQLNDSQLEQLGNSPCPGAYVQRLICEDLGNQAPQLSQSIINADDLEGGSEGQFLLKGNVSIENGQRLLRADRAVINQEQKTAELSGDVELREPGLLLTGDSLFLDNLNDSAHLRQVEYLLYEPGLRGKADSLERPNTGSMRLQNASFTSCPPGDEGWNFIADELELDAVSEQGVGRGVTVEVGGLPVFYTPYIRFPISDKRASGFLFPAISEDSDNGVDLALPYYFNLAPNYDLTLIPRFIQHRGSMLEGEARYLAGIGEFDLQFGYLPDDQGGHDDQERALLDDGLLSEDDLHIGADRWLAAVDHKGHFGEGWSTLIDFTEVSDEDYFRHLGSDSLEVNAQTHLLKRAELGHRSQHWDSRLRVEEYQPIYSQLNRRLPYRQRPRLNVDGDYDFSLWGLDGWQIKLDNEFTSFDQADPIDERGNSVIMGDRRRLDYRLSLDQQWVWGFLKPEAGLRHLSYALDESNLSADASSDPSITAPLFSLDGGLYFERDFQFDDRRLQQTLEPRLFYLYSAYRDHSGLFDLTDDGRYVFFDSGEPRFSYNSLFRDSRFSGGDRIDDANQISLGISSRFIDQNSGRELLRIDLGQVFYFRERLVSLSNRFSAEEIEQHEATERRLQDEYNNAETEQQRLKASVALEKLRYQTDPQSDLMFQVSGRVSEYWGYRLAGGWNVDSGEATQGSLGLHYQRDRRLFNLGYNYSRRPSTFLDPNQQDELSELELFDTSISQGDLSFAWPITNKWSFIASFNHDFTNDRELDNLAGLEYNNCCYRIRLVGRRWIQSNLASVLPANLDEVESKEGIFFQFEFKGLGAFGGRLQKILEEDIWGFTDREQTLQ